MKISSTMSCRPARRSTWLLLVWLAWVLPVASPATAQQPVASRAGQPSVETLVRLEFQLHHQPVGHVMKVLDPFLSDQGRVEIDRQLRTVTVRDHRTNVEKILESLQDFDHPVRALAFDVILLRATRSQSPDLRTQNERALPGPVVEGLGFMLTQNLYTLVARVELEGREGERAEAELGEQRRVGILAGTVLGGQVLPVQLELARVDRPASSGFNKNLNLQIGRTTVLGLASDPSLESGWVVAITSRQASDLTLPRRGEE